MRTKCQTLSLLGQVYFLETASRGKTANEIVLKM